MEHYLCVIGCIVLVVTLLFPPVVLAQAEPLTPVGIDYMLLVKSRYQVMLTPKTLPHDASFYMEIISEQLDDGSWPDIDYEDQQPGSWRPAIHLTRIRELAIAYSVPDHEFCKDDTLFKSIQRGLDFWVTHRFQARNWWWNEIGVPQHMRDIFLLMESDLEKPLRDHVIEVIGQHNMRGEGANLIWSASLALIHACMTEDKDRLNTAAQAIWDEIEVGASEGIQADWSYHQHGPRLQMFHYGRGFVQNIIQMAWLLQDTPWAIPDEKKEIMSNLLLNGMQWMSRGAYTVPGTVDRMASRTSGLRSADMSVVLSQWCDIHSERQVELTEYMERLKTGEPPLVGFRHYPRSDFSVYHRPGYSFFLRTVSSRTLLTENINNENIPGVAYLNCGEHFLLRDGSEINNLQPLWQWDRLPGMTMTAGLEVQHRSAFTGGLGNEVSGFTVFDHQRKNEDDTASLHMRKFTACHNDLIIHLMAPVAHANLKHPVTTGLEQVRLSGPARVAVANDAPQDLPNGDHSLNLVRWVYHNAIGYYLFPPANIGIKAEETTGSWHSINRNYDEDDWVTAPMFSAMIMHETPQPQGYAILPDISEEDLEALTHNVPWDILQNNESIQAIHFDDGTCMIAFYDPGEIQITSSFNLAVDQPCLVLWDGISLSVCDPTQSGIQVILEWNDASREISLPADGSSVVWD